MSLSSVTMKTDNLIHLGYPEGAIMNEYYSARADEDCGFVVAYMMGDVVMIQFFPWPSKPDIHRDDNMLASGHEAYAAFITNRATQIMANKGELFTKYPFITAPTIDLLMIKCLIEEKIKELHDAKSNPEG